PERPKKEDDENLRCYGSPHENRSPDVRPAPRGLRDRPGQFGRVGQERLPRPRRQYRQVHQARLRRLQLGVEREHLAADTVAGAKSGTLTVTGQVDQGTSANKGMRLFTNYAGYSDDGATSYQTDAAALPALNMQ